MDMQNIDSEKKDAALDQARYDLAFSLRKLGTATQQSVDDLQAKVKPIKDAVNIKQHFKNHFWKTGLVCVGIGLFMARKKVAPLRLSQQQINYILNQLQKNMKSTAMNSENQPPKKPQTKLSQIISASDLFLPIGFAVAKGIYEKISEHRAASELDTNKTESEIHPIAINHHIPSTVRTKSTH